MDNINISAFAGFVLLWAVQVVLPGPNFVRVSTAALTGSRSLAIITSAGTSAGNAAWCLLAALGVAFISNSPGLGVVLRLLGASYFAWYGIRLIASAFQPMEALDSDGVMKKRAFSSGLATALANPQTGVFLMTALQEAFYTINLAVIVVASITVAVVNFGWYLMVASILDAPASRTAYLRVRPALGFLFGCILLFSAVKLVRSAL
jgi:threonine efflux protein